MSNIIIDSRMKCVADCVRQDAILADIGTDHGKLPIYLVQTGRAKKAVAADINEMPLQKAQSNIKKYGLEVFIDTFLTDGLVGIEKFNPTDVVIAGMGGELIAQILCNQTIEKTNVKYILQPMTKEDELREWLCKNGYEIIDEYLVKENKLYQVICATFTGKEHAMSQAEYLIGRINIEKKEKYLDELLSKVILRINTKIEGKQKAMLDINQDKKCLESLIAIKEKYYG